MVLICGLTLLIDTALMAAFVGWFVGTDMILASALLIFCGGAVLALANRPFEAVAK
ncbi:MAG TPA: hypothetical protein VGS10_21320 [Terracidiphilus sp.]|nr:hypothetical protein [Terracidiphilus sp.]